MDEEKDMEVQEQNTTYNANSSDKVERKGFNITSMILGIVSIVLFCFWYISIPCSIIAIIFSIAGRKNEGRGMGVAGMILGIIAISLWVLLFILAIVGVASLGSAALNSAVSSSSLYY